VKGAIPGVTAIQEAPRAGKVAAEPQHSIAAEGLQTFETEELDHIRCVS
jgi:hypothetical protein